MQERELRHMIGQVKAGTLSRREFVQAMLAVELPSTYNLPPEASTVNAT